MTHDIELVALTFELDSHNNVNINQHATSGSKAISFESYCPNTHTDTQLTDYSTGTTEMDGKITEVKVRNCLYQS